jgi:hypothetical protein
MALQTVGNVKPSTDLEEPEEMDQALLKKTAAFASRYYKSRVSKMKRGGRKVVARAPFTQKLTTPKDPIADDQSVQEAFPQQIHEGQANIVGDVLQEGANVVDQAADDDNALGEVSEKLKGIAEGIENIVNKKCQERLDYALYMNVVQEAVQRFQLNARQTLWALFEVGAQFFRHEQEAEGVEDDPVLVQWPGQAIHQLGLQNEQEALDQLMVD